MSARAVTYCRNKNVTVIFTSLGGGEIIIMIQREGTAKVVLTKSFVAMVQ